MVHCKWNAKTARPMGQRPYKAGPNQGTPPGPCYNCGGDHWVRDCPHPRRERNGEPGVPPLTRYCADFGIKHLVQDCPIQADKKGKATLNYVEVLPSSSNPTSSSETDPVIPLKVITRAQAQAKKNKKENKTETAPSERSNKTKGSWKAQRERKAASKKKREQARAVEKIGSEQKETEEN